MKTVIKYAQDLIKARTYVCCGFNSFIIGDERPTYAGYADKQEAYEMMQGYDYAEKMAKEDSIAFVYPFKCGQSKCYPFQYGGFFVCNTCGRKSVDKEWWKIQVEKDGAAYCCHGLDFVNIQESDNYAFGDTFQQAIDNYGKVMLQKQVD